MPALEKENYLTEGRNAREDLALLSL